ncbi:MAG: hypothetical protein RXR20_12295 [Paraburkholderia sp.]|uniref:hypothetical protein n=2 Tax=Burkholderiaceae TaxID=119060 RepID=UPI0010F967A4|nr:hypothetical protein [Burkholderia sp. 4M9327F10]
MELELQPVDSPPEPTHRFSGIAYRGIQWDLSHLDSFSFKVDLGIGSDITVLVLFSCHCFSHSFQWDGRSRHVIPAREIYSDGKEHRVLDPQRYELSRRFLREIVVNLSGRHITVADEKQPNFVTLEHLNADGTSSLYAVFFEVKKDSSRRRRLVLRVQSAYLLDKGLTRRQAKGGKVAFETLLRATYLGKPIRG